MKYIELKIHASRQGVEMMSELLMRNGITSVSVDDPADLQDILDKKNEYGWDYIDDEVKARPDREPVVRAYLEDSDEGRRRLQSLKEKIMNLKSLELEGHFGWDVDFGRLYAEARVVDDEDWKDKWKENFHPIHITDRIVVKPSWEEYRASEEPDGEGHDGTDEIVIDIDPGMAFGTGSHETTRLCVRLMEKYGADHRSLLDVGCGSGILAMVGAGLGFDEILGVEIDPDAVRVAEENIRRNGFDDRITVRQGDLAEGLDQKTDMIVANLMADLVIRLASDCRSHLTDSGVFISSGILTEKKEAVAKAIEDSGFEIVEIAEEGEWCAIAARKTGEGWREKQGSDD